MNIKTDIAHYFRCLLTRISPKLNTMVTYRAKFGKKLDFDHPKTLNEKILWLKFNDYWENPLVKQCADKYQVREYIKAIGCQDILNELIAVYESVDEIEWDKLPDSFVMKINFGCGYNIIVPDKTKFDRTDAEQKLRKWIKTKYYLGYSEMQYKDVKPYILVERYLKPHNGVLPEDYKFYCFDGEAPYVMVCTDRQEGGKHPRYWYITPDWERQRMTYDAIKDQGKTKIPTPAGIDEAFEYARKLSKGFPFVRVDLYLVDGKVFFGELTFTPSGGQDNGRVKEADEILGTYLKRP